HAGQDHVAGHPPGFGSGPVGGERPDLRRRRDPFGRARNNRPAPPAPAASDLTDLVGERARALRRRGHQRTSATVSGGTCRYEIEGDRPTVSPAISSASRKLEAAR